jgi:hypothetical protein
MGQAWPRFLRGSTPEALALALIIEAYAIVVEQLAEGQQDLIDAHERAMSYASFHYSPGEIRNACNACATAPGNSNILLHYLTTFCARPSVTAATGQAAKFRQPVALPEDHRQVARLIRHVGPGAGPAVARPQLDAA